MISNKYDPSKVKARSKERTDLAMQILPQLLGTVGGAMIGMPQLGGVASAVTQMFQMGGPVEVEKKEVALRKDGSSVKFNGKPHSKGGIKYQPSMLEEYIFSDELGYDSKGNITDKPVTTFADAVRKLGDDPISLNTKEAIMRDNDKARQMVQPLPKFKYGGKKYQLGGPVPPSPDEIQKYLSDMISGLSADSTFTTTGGGPQPILGMNALSTDPLNISAGPAISNINSNVGPSTLANQTAPKRDIASDRLGNPSDSSSVIRQLTQTPQVQRTGDYQRFSTPNASFPAGFNQPNYTGNSVSDYFKAAGLDPSFNERKKYAEQLGIAGYTGTTEQNKLLLDKMRSLPANRNIPITPINSTYPSVAPSNIQIPPAVMPNRPDIPSTTGQLDENGITVDKYKAGLAGSLIGPLVNLMQGTVGRTEVQPFRENTNANEVDNLMGRMSANNTAMQNRRALSRRAALSNAKNARSEQVAQALSQNISAQDQMNGMQLALQQQGMLNQILGQRASVLESRGERDRQTNLMVDDVNARNRAAKDASFNMGITQLNDLSKYLMQSDIIDKDNKLRNAVLSGMFANFTTNPELLNNLSKGQIEMINDIINFRDNGN